MISYLNFGIIFLQIEVVCFDAKFDFDDSAAFRQKKIFALDNHAEDDPREKEAMEHNLSFVGLDGNIACLGKKREYFY